MIEFELYCETFLDRWISTLETELKLEEDPEEDPEDELYYESDLKSENEREYVPGLEPEPEHELGFEPDPELEVDQESELESCKSLNDEALSSKLRRIQNGWTIADED
ncbi:unnamed protein product [Fraxinus pennsylvanica]|uniref:Uncharacterized protein n=1 Tax=Fraxinus pennsylvanica TaxID=56036 RepID=A0AAD1ZVW7_9LAMI|nr:unnamed protein product [Fraxinus pennsylvanica]